MIALAVLWLCICVLGSQRQAARGVHGRHLHPPDPRRRHHIRPALTPAAKGERTVHLLLTILVIVVILAVIFAVIGRFR